MSFSRRCFLLLALLGLVFLADTVPNMPDPVAVHFGGRGFANGWSTRAVYFAGMILFGLVLPVLVVGFTTRLGRTKPQMLNVPNRDYWLREPSRHAEGLRRLQDHMWWLACLLLLFALAIHWLLLAANRQTPPHLPLVPFFVALAGFVVGLGVWIASFHRVMRAPPPEGDVPRVLNSAGR